VQPLLSSFSGVALDAAREAAPELPRALLLEALTGDWRMDLVRLGCIAVNPKHTLLSEDLVRDLRGAGVRVATWTVNDAARVSEVANWGVDTIITDAVDTIAPDSLPAQR
jgi:glycerophosphoryl diester phosphodiesterase